MKILIYFTAGFSLPALMVTFSLVKSYFSNEWSGLSPLSSIYAIPLFYFFGVFLIGIYFFSFRRCVKSFKSIFLVGMIGALPLMFFVHKIALFLVGIEIPFLLFVYIFMAIMLKFATGRLVN